LRKPRADGEETKRNLLLSASEVFAMRGFRGATIAEICRKAGANTAAVNYHFGSKEAIYVACWRFAFEQSLLKYPPDGGMPQDAAPEVRLRARILAIMRRIVDPGSHELDIVYKETASPTGLLTHAIQEVLEPVFLGLNLTIRELLGAEATEEQVRLCLMSIRAQCFGPWMRQRRRRLHPARPLPSIQDPVMDNVEALADHVTRFSLAGIRAVQDQAEDRPAYKMM